MSQPRRYVRRRRPIHVSVEVGGPAAKLLSALFDQQLRYGHPSNRRGGAVIAPLVARPLPARPLGLLVSVGMPRRDPDLDRLVEEIVADWPRLTSLSAQLPQDPPDVAVLAVRRRASRIVFLVDQAGDPLVVAKLPHVSTDADPETDALTRAAPSGVVPQPLGRIAGGWLQEGRRGAPPALRPLDPADAAQLSFTGQWSALATGLVRIAETTRAEEPPDLLPPLLDAAAAWSMLPRDIARRVDDTAQSLRGLTSSVLGHGDMSAQNWLVDGPTLTGIVDWSDSVHRAAPGFDALHAAVSYVEQSVGLRRWSPARAVEAFSAAWPDSPFIVGVRRSFRQVAAAGGVPPELHDALEVAYFARRLGFRLAHPGSFLLPTTYAAEQLGHVCRT